MGVGITTGELDRSSLMLYLRGVTLFLTIYYSYIDSLKTYKTGEVDSTPKNRYLSCPRQLIPAYPGDSLHMQRARIAAMPYGTACIGHETA